MTVHAVAFDRAGNFDTFTGVYKPPVGHGPGPGARLGHHRHRRPGRSHDQLGRSETRLTLYGVQLYVFDSSNVKVTSGPLRETSAKTMTINGLNPGTEYYYTVKAKNSAGYGPESTAPGPADPDRRDRHRHDRDGEVEER